MTAPIVDSATDRRSREGLSRWLARAAALLGGAAYALLGYGQMHGQVSVLDEGLYLYKGLLYAQGTYWPFQDFGPLTNHMPLSFLIPGWVQLLFRPGLATGRTYAWVVALLMLLGLWLATRRLAGPWWAAGVVWLVVLNTGWIKIYSQAISQGLIACMLVWTIAIGVGEGRRPWQAAVAAALAGVMGLTRINLMPVVLLYVVYAYWAHGRSMGHTALVSGGVVLLSGHLIFWPGILKLWAAWLPAAVTPFLNPFRDHAGGASAWQVLLAAGSKWGILKDSLRLHFASVAGVVWAWLLVPSNLREEKRGRLLTMAFLTGLFLLLFVLHAAATLGGTYCPYCLKNYLAFFSPIGLIALAIAGAHWLPRAGISRQAGSLFALLLLPWVLGFSLGTPFSQHVLASDLPRLSRGAILPGTAALGSMVTQKFGLIETTLLNRLNLLQTVGLALFVILSIALVARAARAGRRGSLAASAMKLLWIATAGAVAAATFSLGANYHTYDCGLDVIASQTEAGADLAAKIPAGSSVYWGSGGRSPIAFLFLDHVSIYPAQLNGVYSYRYGGDPAELPRLGYWNPSLASSWLAEADYVLVEAQDFEGWLATSLNSKDFDQITRTPPTNPCQPNSSLMIFRRIQAAPQGP
jgi:hypothetical protein